MKISRLLVCVFAAVTIYLPSSLYANELAPKGVECEAPTFSKENIISIVKKARLINKGLPAEINNPEIIIHRQRCHYIYTEVSRPGETDAMPVSVVISEFGAVVDFIEGRAVKSLMECPDVGFSEIQLTKRLQELRRKDKSLPKPVKNSETSLGKLRCMYVYYEKPSGSKGKGYSYTFDYYGDIYDVKPYKY